MGGIEGFSGELVMTRFAGRLTALGCNAAALALLVANTVSAGTSTTTFIASATIAASCTVAATNLAFGTYSATSATALAGTSTVNVYCTSGTPYTVALSVGSGGGTFAARDMANGANLMAYNLYTSAAHTAIWGDGTASTSTVAGTGAGVLTSSPSTVYGNIPIAQDLPPGTYTSTITVTVNY
jgi:spore coat protein U-like protein